MQPHKSRAKNQMIADVFFRAGFIETWGRGIGKVRDEMEARHLQMPVWRNICGGIEVTIERETYKHITGEIGTTHPEIGTNIVNVPDRTSDWRTDLQQRKGLQKRQKELLIKLMEELSADNTITYETLSANLGKARSTVQDYTLYLIENRFIKRIGSRKTGYWEILEIGK